MNLINLRLKANSVNSGNFVNSVNSDNSVNFGNSVNSKLLQEVIINIGCPFIIKEIIIGINY